MEYSPESGSVPAGRKVARHPSLFRLTYSYLYLVLGGWVAPPCLECLLAADYAMRKGARPYPYPHRWMWI